MFSLDSDGGRPEVLGEGRPRTGKGLEYNPGLRGRQRKSYKKERASINFSEQIHRGFCVFWGHDLTGPLSYIPRGNVQFELCIRGLRTSGVGGSRVPLRFLTAVPFYFIFFGFSDHLTHD